MSCCPPNSEPYLAPDYQTKGKLTAVGGVDFYATGEPAGKKAVLIVPDVFGWNSGRTRHFADLLAQEGYYAVVPKVMAPLEGGTDGDGLPANFDLAARGGELMPYIKGSLNFEAVGPPLKAVLRHLLDSGVSKVAIVGFCYGGWPMAKILAGDDLPAQVVCGISPHPSITVEEASGGNTAQLLGGAKRPILLLPAGNDPDRYRPNGDIYEALKATQPESAVSLDFGSMIHGWVARGDISDPEVKKHVSLAYDQILKFLAAQFAKAG